MREEAKSTLSRSRLFLLDPGGSPSRASEGGSSLSTFLLTHLVSLVGQVAFRQVVHLEVAVSAELRRRRTLREEKIKKRSIGSTKKRRPQVRTEVFGFLLWAAPPVSHLLLQQTYAECIPEDAQGPG